MVASRPPSVRIVCACRPVPPTATPTPPVPMSLLPTLLHSSLFWWFVPLAAIPLVLHLLTLHRLRTVELSTFRFLFDSYVQQRRRMQFLEALLAILRVLFLLALVFVFCRPVVKHWDQLFGGSGATGGGRDVVLLVDCSASMNAR